MPTTKTLREGSTQKRAAILTAARELFLSDGFDRTSVDAVAARAGVSKRTVYDYFGDKQTLLQAVVDGVGQSLITTIGRILDDTLAEPTEAIDLEDVLVTFAMRIATDTLWPTPPTWRSPRGSPPSRGRGCSKPPLPGSRPTSSSR